MTRLAPIALALGLLLGCADTNAPPPDPVELLVVVNSQANTVTIVPVDQSEAPDRGTARHPEGAGRLSIAARERFAIVPFGDIDAGGGRGPASSGTLVHRIPLPPGSGATGAIMLDDSIGVRREFAAQHRLAGQRALRARSVEVPVGVIPAGLRVRARGRLFVLNGNLDETGEPVGPSWITVINPATNQPRSRHRLDSAHRTGQRRLRHGGRRRTHLHRESRPLDARPKDGSRWWIRWSGRRSRASPVSACCRVRSPPTVAPACS